MTPQQENAVTNYIRAEAELDGSRAAKEYERAMWRYLVHTMGGEDASRRAYKEVRWGL
jgi:hypothetical protein